ncbi:hypothetical protein [Desulfuromonas thiophila]|jgi:hypothetical protein|uniref:DUF3311 domain-containing protein n=1 Tax=Desulfuromonas thiophila TaxID=57664 RepID=A0A1G7D0A5_9BACT|nr:hypothetical protein [Desulfuromonas thiophila]MDD3800702.1 hypothetical protein [Desulfuromonas thiophila]MDY0398476.1 hypothetical protein [Desulfuromonas thiophila]SDE44949.1 hypothetical protein SAMN05661003_11164 [Desulfuromonas thiophila]
MTELNSAQKRQLWLAFFLLGLILLNFPFLQIFNRIDTLFGIPLLVVYFLLGWPASIAVIYLFSKRLDASVGSSGR